MSFEFSLNSYRSFAKSRKSWSVAMLYSIFIYFIGLYNNRLSGTPSIGVEFALPDQGRNSKLHDNRRVRLEALVIQPWCNSL
jgi:hypothetical protein